jgi:sortase A
LVSHVDKHTQGGERTITLGTIENVAFRDRLPPFRDIPSASKQQLDDVENPVQRAAKHVAGRVSHHAKHMADRVAKRVKQLSTRAVHHAKLVPGKAAKHAKHMASRVAHHAKLLPSQVVDHAKKLPGRAAKHAKQAPHTLRKFFTGIPSKILAIGPALKKSISNFSARTVDKIIGVVGEVLMTAGIFVLLFLGWHVWYNDLVSGIAQNNAGAELSNQWDNVPLSVPEFDRNPGDSSGARLSPEPPVTASPALNARFATLIVPRFGDTFERAIAYGVDPKKVLNVRSAGLGHYPQTNELGELGNFAIAGHRTTFGAPLGNIDQLRVGDRLYVESEAGWYVYRYRNLEYVWPKDVAVLKPVPWSNVAATDRLLTLTSCHPKLSSAERVIAYSVFETFVPRDRGAPSEVAAMKAASQ